MRKGPGIGPFFFVGRTTGGLRMISHHHRVLYVHVPKCGGESIEQTFLADLGFGWENRAALLIAYNGEPKAGPRQLSHLTAQQYLDFKYMTPAQFADYYKFATVRDPVSRTVSFYNYLFDYYLWLLARRYPHRLVPAVASKRFSISGFIDKVLVPTLTDARGKTPGTKRYHRGYYYFLRPQSDYLFAGDKMLVDDVYRLEEIGASWPAIKERCGLTTDLGRRNESRKFISMSDLSDRHVRKIVGLYAEDYEKLGFSRV